MSVELSDRQGNLLTFLLSWPFPGQEPELEVVPMEGTSGAGGLPDPAKLEKWDELGEALARS